MVQRAGFEPANPYGRGRFNIVAVLERRYSIEFVLKEQTEYKAILILFDW